MNLSEAIHEHRDKVKAVKQIQDDQKAQLERLNGEDRKGDKPTKRGLPDYKAEDSVSLALAAPFIQNILGYDLFDLNQVVSEYPADIGYAKEAKKQGKAKKIDYAIMQKGKPITPLLIVECKSRQQSFPPPHYENREWKDLRDYFEAVSMTSGAAPTLLYTDGIRYIFYSDCETRGTMDKEPFLALDWRSLTDEEVRDLTAFVECLRSDPTPDVLRACACQIKERTDR